MRRTAAVFLLEFANLKVYWGDTLANLASYPIQLVVLFITWTALFAASKTHYLGNYGVNGIVAYYFALSVVAPVVGAASETENTVWNDVVRGELDKYMFRPISYPGFLFARCLSKATIRMLMGLPMLVVFLMLGGFPIAPTNLLGFCLLTIIGCSVYFLVWFLFGMLSFRMERVFGPRDVLWTIISFASGAVIPLDLLPSSLRLLLAKTPFQYVFYMPVSVALGRAGLHETVTSTLISLAWVGVLGLVASVVWNRASRAYSSPGN